MAKGKIKKVSPTWSIEAEVLLLNWLDKNKGPDGSLRQDEDAAIGSLVADDSFIRQHEGISEIATEEGKRQNIQLKLKNLWNKYKRQKYEVTPFSKTIMYNKGSEVLDWNTLETRYRDLYTPEEYQARKNVAGLDTSNVGSKGDKRKSRNGDVPDGLGDSSPKRPRTQDGTLPNEPTAASQDPPLDPTGGHPQSQPPAPVPQPLSRVERRTRQDMLLSDLDLLQLPKFKKLVGHGGVQFTALTDLSELQSRMAKIYRKIQTTVEEYVRSCNLHKIEYIVLEPESAYPAKLRELLTLILAGSAERVEGRREIFHSLRNEKRISYEFFIRSLLIAAVVKWCLGSNLEENNIYKSYGGGVIREVFMNELDPVVEGRLRQKFMNAYVEREVVPHIQPRARDMASRFQGFLDLVVPRNEVGAYLSEVEGVCACPRTDPATRSSTTHLPCSFTESPNRINFREGLRDVFELALEASAANDKKMYERYRYSFPAFGHEYSSEDMIPEEDEDGNESLPKRPVILCLLPITYRSVQDRFLGDWSEMEKVANGVVL
ncbi:hypothetical protein H2200_012088 [Cladophialophora chaetospira]|uniref:Uncharacterized protein n=1 Tax=Cladophialophora chaetospira TaxID=386627 RepID=A0AA38WY58_9EURO|nr:hypothetical protein H2200_012088 [Cladophialophora chaetospira]